MIAQQNQGLAALTFAQATNPLQGSKFQNFIMHQNLLNQGLPLHPKDVLS